MPARRNRPRPRALTVAAEDQLLTYLTYSDDAVKYDLADLCEFLAGTGLRIGEAVAVRDEVITTGTEEVDGKTVRTGTVEVDAKVARVRGKGLQLQRRPKSAAGWRVIALPEHLVTLVERRREAIYPDNALGLVFPTVLGNLRDPSNTAGDLRRALDWCGADWVTAHTFRRTVATRLLNAGVPPQQVSDHLGHAKPSMTLDVYAGRDVVTAQAATILAR